MEKFSSERSDGVVRGFQGFEQLNGHNYTQTYAGVCRSASWKFTIAIAAIFDLEIDQMDAVTAFLNTSIDDNIYVKLLYM